MIWQIMWPPHFSGIYVMEHWPRGNTKNPNLPEEMFAKTGIPDLSRW